MSGQESITKNGREGEKDPQQLLFGGGGGKNEEEEEEEEEEERGLSLSLPRITRSIYLNATGGEGEGGREGGRRR